MRRALIVLMVLPALLAGCGRQQQADAPPAGQWQLPVLVVTAGAPLEYTAIGSVVSDRRVDVASRLSGYIRDLRVQEGDAVRVGQLLARIDAADVESAIRQAQAAFASAGAAANDARIDVERFQALFAQHHVSDSEMRKARLRQDAAAEALNQARAALAAASAQRDYAEIRSPLDGVVVARLKRAGDLALPGAPILTLETGRGLMFETSVAEQQVARVAVGQPVAVRIDGIGAPLAGRVQRVVASADPVTRSYPVKIALPETRGLLPGMFGRADFVLGETPVPVVPAAALVERGGLRGVFVVDDAGTARFRWLRLGREWPDRVEATAGLRPGERIVAVGEPALREGDAVTATGTAGEAGGPNETPVMRKPAGRP